MRKTFLLTLGMSATIIAQHPQVKLGSLKPKSEEFNFPVVTFASKPKVAEKINTYLQVIDLEYIPGSSGNPNRIATTGGISDHYKTYFYKYKKLDSPKNVLSLEIDGENKLNYSDPFTDWKNFDLRTGNYITARDLFDDENALLIENRINKEVQQKILDYITELRSDENKAQEKSEVIRLYKACIEFSEKVNLEKEKFYFDKNNLVFVRSKCSSSSMRHLDELGDIKIPISYNEIDSHLNLFGKSLFSKQEKIVYQSRNNNKIYLGKLDQRYPIKVIFNNGDGSNNTNAIYWYENKKQPLFWKGNLIENHLSLEEFNTQIENQWDPIATIEADIKGKKITGSWKDFKTKKILPLELEEL